MGIISKLVRLDRKFAWSFFGFVLAAIFGCLTLYAQFFRDTRAKLRYEILNNTSILDVKEDVDKLEIIYDGKDIKKSKQSLRVVVFRVGNEGEQDILKTHYDENDPLGVAIESGKIIRPELLGATNKYLERNMQLTVVSSTTVTFSSVILEAGEAFTTKLLILHPAESIPDIKAIGKVAGVKKISISEIYKDKDGPSFLRKTFAGPIWVQAIRLISYSIGLIVCLFLVITPMESLFDKLERRRRRKLVPEFGRHAGISLSKRDEYVLEKFDEYGPSFMTELLCAAEDKDYMKMLLTKTVPLSLQDDSNELFSLSITKDSPGKIKGPKDFASALSDIGFLVEAEEGYDVNEQMHAMLRKFVDFLKAKEMYN